MTQSLLLNGLVGYWKLDEGSGSIAIDSSGNGNQGSLVASPTYTSSVPNVNFPDPYAMTFNGSSQYVSVADNSSLIVESNAFTVSGWFNFASQPASGKAMIVLFKAPVSQSGSGYGLSYSNNYAGQTGNYISLYKAGVKDQFIAYTFSNNTWYHIVAVQNYSGGSPSSVTYYVNGNSIGSFSNASAYQSSSGQALSIGAGNVSNAVLVGFNGSIDDVRVYNRALSSTEISNLYNGTY